MNHRSFVFISSTTFIFFRCVCFVETVKNSLSMTPRQNRDQKRSDVTVDSHLKKLSICGFHRPCCRSTFNFSRIDLSLTFTQPLPSKACSLYDLTMASIGLTNGSAEAITWRNERRLWTFYFKTKKIIFCILRQCFLNSLSKQSIKMKWVNICHYYGCQANLSSGPFNHNRLLTKLKLP